MKRIKFHLRSDSDAYAASAKVLAVPADGTVDVVIKNHESDRSLKQNSLSFRWYKELGDKQNSGNGATYERNFCKWTYGFPILLEREDCEPEIKRMWDILLTIPHEQRIEAMEMVEVTRLFKVNEFARYLSAIERYAGDNGYHLTRPEDEYDEAMGRYRL
jgi:hypothetical protein